jgi:hypothetical protein
MQTLLYLNYINEAKQIKEPEPPPPPTPEQVQAQITAANIENIQKYILFNKILNLKYQLENSPIRKLDHKSYSEALYFLNIIISFFDSFSLNDLNVTIDMVLNQIITSSELSQPDLSLITDPNVLAQTIITGKVPFDQVVQAVHSGQVDPEIAATAGKILQQTQKKQVNAK